MRRRPRKTSFNFGKVKSIGGRSANKSFSVKVPRRRQENIDYCNQKMYPSPDNGVLANLARNIPNVDVFAYYKSSYRRWQKALEIAPTYEDRTVEDNVPYRNFYFPSCKSVTNYWEVKFRDDGQLEFGVDINSNDDGSGNNNIPEIIDSALVGNGTTSTSYECTGTPYIVFEGEEIELGGEVQIIKHPEIVLCRNGSCIQGNTYIPVADLLQPTTKDFGYITFPLSADSESTRKVNQLFGNNLSYLLEKNGSQELVECDGNCTISTNYGSNPRIGVIEYGNGRSHLTKNLPLSFTVEQSAGDGYLQTWTLPDGCTEEKELFTTEPVESYSIENTDSHSAATEGQPASEGVEYCSGSPGSKLEWNSGEYESENTPLSYSLRSRLISIDGLNFSTEKDIDLADPYVINSQLTPGQCPGVIYDVACGYRWILPGRFIRRFDFLSPSSANFVGPITEAKVVTLDPNGNEITTGGGTLNRIGLRVVSDGGSSTSFFQFQQGTNIYVYEVLYVSIYPRTPEPPECSGEICTLSINHVDGTIFEYGQIPCNANIQVLKNIVDVEDAVSTQTFTYDHNLDNFIITCYQPQSGWLLNFQPQNISLSFDEDCKPSNVVINQSSDEGGCCAKKQTVISSGTFDTAGIHNPPTIDCRVDPYTGGNAPQVCYPEGTSYLGYLEDSGGNVTTFYRQRNDEQITDVCAETSYKISIFGNGVLEKEDTVCGDPTELVKISTYDQLVYQLYISENGNWSSPYEYIDYDPTSNPELFYIIQLPYKEVIQEDGRSIILPEEIDVQYECRNRVGGGNGPFTVNIIQDPTTGRWIIQVIDANGNVVQELSVDQEPSINDPTSKSPYQISTLNQDPYLTCTCPDHDRKIFYFDKEEQEEGFVRDWSNADGAGAPNILGTRCCKHVFSVLNQLGLSERYTPEDFPTEPVEERFIQPSMIGEADDVGGKIGKI